jgi:hypothetical protein
MKSILLRALFCSFFFLSCSSDDSITDSASQSEHLNQKKKYARSSTQIVNNAANAYDLTGDLQYQILVSVVNSAPANTLSSIVASTNAAALNNTGFIAIAPSFTGITESEVQWVMSNTAQTVVNTSGASTAGKVELTLLLELMDGAEAYDYADNYDVIVEFENKIINSTNLTAADKVLILRTTSIARHLCFYVDDKDRDWRGVKNGLHGAIKGATTNLDTAITLAVACGVQQNFN